MIKRKLILSTGNLNKVEEIKNILRDLPIEVLTKDDIGLKDLEVEEDGQTLEENAMKKAKAIGDKVDELVIADDSGLFVECLNGEPGINSARYAGFTCNSEDNNVKLLKELKNIPMGKRSAYFETVIALVKPDGEVVSLAGRCNGSIGFEAKGNGGFGYDPLFIVEGYNKTFAEIGNELKNKISHRSKALEKLKVELENFLEDE